MPTSAVNWFGRDRIVRNQSTVAISPDRSLVAVGGGHPTRLLIHVVGYLV